MFLILERATNTLAMSHTTYGIKLGHLKTVQEKGHGLPAEKSDVEHTQFPLSSNEKASRPLKSFVQGRGEKARGCKDSGIL